MRLRAIAPWTLAGLLVASIAWGGWSASAARAEALEAKGRVAELARQRQLAEAETARAKREAMEWADSVQRTVRAADSVRASSARTIREVRAVASRNEQSLRATLDSAQAVQLDSVVSSKDAEIRAERDARVAAESERDAFRVEVDLLLETVATLEGQVGVLRLENSALRIQAERWEDAANPSLFSKLGREGGRALVWFAAGYVAGE